MEEPRKLRKLAGWNRESAERAGDPAICNFMMFDSRSARASGQTDVVVNNTGISHVASLAPRRTYRLAASRAAMLAFAVGFFVAALGAAADEPARSQPTAERPGTDSVRVQPTAKQFAPPNQPDISASAARTVDALYRLLTGPQPAAFPPKRTGGEIE
jgi:hypothetical protein